MCLASGIKNWAKGCETRQPGNVAAPQTAAGSKSIYETTNQIIIPPTWWSRLNFYLSELTSATTSHSENVLVCLFFQLSWWELKSRSLIWQQLSVYVLFIRAAFLFYSEETITCWWWWYKSHLYSTQTWLISFSIVWTSGACMFNQLTCTIKKNPFKKLQGCWRCCLHRVRWGYSDWGCAVS